MADAGCEWRTVTSKDKKRVMRKRVGKGAKRSSFAVIHSSIGQTETAVVDPNVLGSALRDCQHVLRESSVLATTLQAIEKIKSPDLKKNGERNLPIQRIVCYGIGNFSKTSLSSVSSSFWQLAFGACLQESLSEEEHPLLMAYYDPCSTELETTLVSELLGATVLSGDEADMHPVDGQHTVFFMPHCPISLYEKVLWSNWDELLENKVIIVGNSLRNHCESLFAKSDEVPCMFAVLPWLVEKSIWFLSKSETKEVSRSFEGAFNDTFVSSLSVTQSADAWPCRPKTPSVKPS